MQQMFVRFARVSTFVIVAAGFWLAGASLARAGLLYEYTFEAQWGTRTRAINYAYGSPPHALVANAQHYEQSIDASSNLVLWQISGTAKQPARHTQSARSGVASLQMTTVRGEPPARLDEYANAWINHSVDLNDRVKLNLQGGHSGREKLFAQDKTYYSGFSLRVGAFSEHDTARDQWNVLLAWSNATHGTSAPLLIMFGTNGGDWSPATATSGGEVRLYAWANAFDFPRGKWEQPRAKLPIGTQMLKRGWWYDFVVMTRFGRGGATNPTVKIWMKEAAQKWDANGDGVWQQNERLAYTHAGNLGVVNATKTAPTYRLVATLYRDKHTEGNPQLPNHRDRQHTVYFDEIRIGDGNNTKTPRQEVMPRPEVRAKAVSW
jgi:hypothetical protein